MSEKEQILAQLHELLARWFAGGIESGVPASRYPLGIATYGAEEVGAAMDVLLSDRLTMGERVAQFEREFATFIGARHAVMVNSGSSANLLAFSVLCSPLTPGHLKAGDEVILPALCWPTTVSPLALMGLVPVFVDIDPGTLCIDARAAEAAITEKTRAILPIHVLGNAAPMEALRELALRHNLKIVEDCCEGLGTTLNGKCAGTFGAAGTFSFFYSHQLNTIEGGMLVTDSDEVADLARVLRTYGWARPSKRHDALSKAHPEIDSRFLFLAAGFNFRPTEIQAAFGSVQLAKLGQFNDRRATNAGLWNARLAKYPSLVETTRTAGGCGHTWFYYPFLVKEDAPFTREELMQHLESSGIETRVILTGNFARQPAADGLRHRIHGSLDNVESIMRRGLMWGNSGALSAQRAGEMADILCRFLDRYNQA